MTASEASGLSIGEIGTLVTITAAILTGIVWLIKNVRDIRHEALPNSGGSMNDKVVQIQRELDKHTEQEREAQARIEQQLIGIRDDVQAVHKRVSDHQQWHMDHTEGRAHSRSSD